MCKNLFISDDTKNQQINFFTFHSIKFKSVLKWQVCQYDNVDAQHKFLS